jgi:hypothetical protein
MCRTSHPVCHSELPTAENLSDGETNALSHFVVCKAHDRIPMAQDDCFWEGQFVAHKVSKWAESLDLPMLLIEPGKPWQNGINESFLCGPLSSHDVPSHCLLSQGSNAREWAIKIPSEGATALPPQCLNISSSSPGWYKYQFLIRAVSAKYRSVQIWAVAGSRNLTALHNNINLPRLS